MNARTVERWAPLVLLVALVALWEVACTVLDVPEYIFPSPVQIFHALNEFTGPIALAAWQTFWVTMRSEKRRVEKECTSVLLAPGQAWQQQTRWRFSR